MNFIKSITNEALTANGAVTSKSSLNACLDLFSMGVSTRNKETLVRNAIIEDFILATKVVFYLRDIRNGQGNKDVLRTYHTVLAENVSQDDEFRKKYLKMIKYIPTIGSWKDVYDLYGKNKDMDKKIIKLVHKNLYGEEPDGLCAKWFPRQSAFHKDFAKEIKEDIGEVRRHVAKLTKVVETQMCNKEWEYINYEHVPSIANKKYNIAFLNNDKSRREKFLNDIIGGKTKKTMKASTLYPHQILSNVQDTKTADALWTSLPDYMEGSESFNILPVIDVSGSMHCAVPGANARAINISIGLGLYLAEHNKGAYKDVWCNFSETPVFDKLSGKTLSARVNSLNYRNWGMSTNIEAVFDKILRHSNAAEAPKMVLIISDMEFNYCSRGRNFDSIREKYEEAGFTMPTLVFWRVNVAVDQQPVTMFDKNCMLINGYSPSIMKELIKFNLDSLQEMTPLNVMLNIVQDKYDFVDKYFS